MKNAYDLGCGHPVKYRFRASKEQGGDTACAMCAKERHWKSYGEILNRMRVYEEARKSIPIDCPVGTKVVLWYPHWGYDSDQKRLTKHKLHFGRVYTVRKMDAFNSHTDVYLEEVPGKVPFNSVHFAFATPGDILDNESKPKRQSV